MHVAEILEWQHVNRLVCAVLNVRDLKLHANCVALRRTSGVKHGDGEIHCTSHLGSIIAKCQEIVDIRGRIAVHIEIIEIARVNINWVDPVDCGLERVAKFMPNR